MFRVVLVDDERLILRGLSTVIPWEELGCQVAGTATDGVSGLEMVRTKKPDILLTDIRMPNMDGLTMLAALRSEFPAMQVTVLTAYRDFDYARQALSLGVCRYLLKPSSLGELKEAVRTMTERLAAQAPSPEPESEDQAGHYLVSAALTYMRDHCEEPHLSLGEVADHVYVSQWHLSKLLNRESGNSFFDLLHAMRVEKAKALLRSPGNRVQDVAETVGYADVAHFSKCFKKVTGMTPGEFRKQGL